MIQLLLSFFSKKHPNLYENYNFWDFFNFIFKNKFQIIDKMNILLLKLTKNGVYIF